MFYGQTPYSFACSHLRHAPHVRNSLHIHSHVRHQQSNAIGEQQELHPLSSLFKRSPQSWEQSSSPTRLSRRWLPGPCLRVLKLPSCPPFPRLRLQARACRRRTNSEMLAGRRVILALPGGQEWTYIVCSAHIVGHVSQIGHIATAEL